MSDSDALRLKWDQRHADPVNQPRAVEVLLQNKHLLPPQGQALDLACGLGGNALLLAQAGLDVTAWDLSAVAVDRLRGFAEEKGLPKLQAEVRDVEQNPPPVDTYDVITVSYFLDRPLIPALIASVRPGGLLFYQTFSRIAVTEQGPVNQKFRLDENELLELFSSMGIRFYREENLLGDLTKGFRDVAMLVAEQRKI